MTSIVSKVKELQFDVSQRLYIQKQT